jgi:hypothetical protein
MDFHDKIMFKAYGDGLRIGDWISGLIIIKILNPVSQWFNAMNSFE